MNADNVILNFLKEYKAWAENGAPENILFYRQVGLCTNLHKYADLIEYDAFEASDALMAMFEKDDLNPMLPFNNFKVGQPNYVTEVHHENPFRMKWVADTIIKLEAKQNES